VRDGLAIWAEMLGEEHPIYARGQENLAKTLLVMARPTEALAAAQTALQICRGSCGHHCGGAIVTRRVSGPQPIHRSNCPVSGERLHAGVRATKHRHLWPRGFGFQRATSGGPGQPPTVLQLAPSLLKPWSRVRMLIVGAGERPHRRLLRPHQESGDRMMATMRAHSARQTGARSGDPAV
jgi:hypothetical protein